MVNRLRQMLERYTLTTTVAVVDRPYIDTHRTHHIENEHVCHTCQSCDLCDVSCSQSPDTLFITRVTDVDLNHQRTSTEHVGLTNSWAYYGQTFCSSCYDAIFKIGDLVSHSYIDALRDYEMWHVITCPSLYYVKKQILLRQHLKQELETRFRQNERERRRRRGLWRQVESTLSQRLPTELVDCIQQALTRDLSTVSYTLNPVQP